MIFVAMEKVKNMSRLIDADKLKEELGKSWAFEHTLYDVCRIINEAPTIETRPKGKWIEARHYPGYECSVCHYGVQPWNNTNYCPNCSADMREHKETDHEE